MAHKPNSIFTWQTTFKNAEFLEFGIKYANLAILVELCIPITVATSAGPPKYSAQGSQMAKTLIGPDAVLYVFHIKRGNL